VDFAELQQDFIAEHPEAAEGADDWTIITALRAYATEHVDYVINVDSPYYVDQNGQAVEDRFATFEGDSGGVVCGGAADALTSLARAWGYSAWNLGIGDYSPGGFTHMQTLVQIEVDGVPVLTLHDPSTNLTYSDAYGEPIDYFDLLAELAGRGASGVGVIEDRADSDNLVAPAETDDIAAFAASSWTVEPAATTIEEVDGGWVVASPRTARRFEEVIGPWYGPFLASHGLPEAAIWLQLFPHDVYGDGGDELLARAMEVVAGSRRIGFEASEGFGVGDEGGTVNQRYVEAGYAVQTWYYGGIAVVATEEGQALRVTRVDGLGGDEEGIFELQARTSGAVSARLAASDGGAVHVVVKDAGYQVIHEENVESGGLFSWTDSESRIWRVIVEAEGGDVIVDEFAYGSAAAKPSPDDTGDTAVPGDTADTAGPSDDSGAVLEPSGRPCGCASGPRGPSNWMVAALLCVSLRRRRRGSA
jgi:hypothetical protein